MQKSELLLKNLSAAILTKDTFNILFSHPREEIESSRKCAVASILSHSTSGVVWYIVLLIIFTTSYLTGGVMTASAVTMVTMLTFTLYHLLTSHFAVALRSMRELRCTLRKIQVGVYLNLKVLRINLIFGLFGPCGPWSGGFLTDGHERILHGDFNFI